MLLLTTESKAASLALISMTADTEWTERDMVGFCDNTPPHTHTKYLTRPETTEENSPVWAT